MEYQLHVKDGDLYAVTGTREGFNILTLAGVQDADSPRIAASRYIGNRNGKRLHMDVEPISEGIWKIPYYWETIR